MLIINVRSSELFFSIISDYLSSIIVKIGSLFDAA